MSQVRLISHHTDGLHQKVVLMEAINAEGVRLADLSTEKLIEKAAIIEEQQKQSEIKLRAMDPKATGINKGKTSRPKAIWEILQRNFGADYFLDVIEEEYGISPGANEEITKMI